MISCETHTSFFELEDRIRNLKCPFCEYQAKSVRGFLAHVTGKHPLVECPVCGHKGKGVLIHLSKQNDRMHELFWVIYGSYKRGTHQRSKRLIKLRAELWG